MSGDFVKSLEIFIVLPDIYPMTIMRERLKDLVAKEDIMDTICSHVASGGSLIDLCETWEVRYGDMVAWVRKDRERSRRWVDAQNDRSEWARERILLELKRIGMADIRKVYNKDGSIKEPHEWPSEVASFISSHEVNGDVQKLKFWSKEKALELLGKNLHLFVERVEHSGKLSLEELITAAREENNASKKGKQ